MGLTEKDALRIGLGGAILIIMILFSFIVIPMWIQDFQEEYGYYKIKSHEIRNSDYYFWINGALWNTDRDKYVLPNDFLRYTFTIQKKVDYPIELHSNLTSYVGIHNVTNPIILPISYLTNDESTGGIHLLFHATELGRNVIFAHFKIVNSSNNVILEEFGWDTKFDIVSPEFMSQDIANKNTMWALFISAGIGAGTLVALIAYTAYSRSNVQELRSQTNNLKEQHKIENRPWVSPTEIIPKWVTFQNGTTIEYREAEISIREKTNKSPAINRIYEIEVKNFGHLPVKLRGKINDSPSEITLETLEQLNNNIDEVVMPNESVYFSVSVNRNYLQNGNTQFVGVLLEYNLDKNRSCKISKIWEITKDSQIRRTNWIDDPDMKN